jgi:hypothetical protein
MGKASRNFGKDEMPLAAITLASDNAAEQGLGSTLRQYRKG